MAYKILYDSGIKRKRSHHKPRLVLLTLGFFALFSLMACHLVPGELDALRQMLFPQNQAEALLQDLRDGEAIADAVTAFCQDILNGN